MYSSWRIVVDCGGTAGVGGAGGGIDMGMLWPGSPNPAEYGISSWPDMEDMDSGGDGKPYIASGRLALEEACMRDVMGATWWRDVEAETLCDQSASARASVSTDKARQGYVRVRRRLRLVPARPCAFASASAVASHTRPGRRKAGMPRIQSGTKLAGDLPGMELASAGRWYGAPAMYSRRWYVSRALMLRRRLVWGPGPATPGVGGWEDARPVECQGCRGWPRMRPMRESCSLMLALYAATFSLSCAEGRGRGGQKRREAIRNQARWGRSDITVAMMVRTGRSDCGRNAERNRKQIEQGSEEDNRPPSRDASEDTDANVRGHRGEKGEMGGTR